MHAIICIRDVSPKLHRLGLYEYISFSYLSEGNGDSDALVLVINAIGLDYLLL